MPVAFVLATAREEPRGSRWPPFPCLKLKRSLPGVELGGNAYQAILRRAEDGVGRGVRYLLSTASESFRLVTVLVNAAALNPLELYTALYDSNIRIRTKHPCMFVKSGKDPVMLLFAEIFGIQRVSWACSTF